MAYNEMIPPALQHNFEIADEITGDYIEDNLSDPLEDFGGDEISIVIEGDSVELTPIKEFFDNLVEDIEEAVLTELATDLVNKVEQDKDDRSEKDTRNAQTLRRLGYSGDIMGGADFPGASKVTHPLLTEMCVDFSSRAIKELMPPNGCVKTKIIGHPDSRTIEEADNKKSYLNYLLTEKMRYRDTLERLLSQLPLGGSQYLKLFWDEEYQEPKCVFVPIDKVYLPFYADDFYTAERLCHVQRISEREYEQRIDSGVYSEVHKESGRTISGESELPFMDGSDISKSESIAKLIDGVNESQADNEDGHRKIYEIHTFLSIEEDDYTNGKSAPYIITIDVESNCVLSIYRNWNRADVYRKPLVWFVEFKYIPFRGVYGIGLPEIMDGVATAVNGATRAVLDAGMQSNFPPIIKNKKAKMTGQNSNVTPGVVTELDMGVGAENSDIRQMLHVMPVAQPSPVLMQMMQYFDSKAQSFQANINGVTDSLQNGDAPVGTTLALIEENSKRYAAIHARAHESQHMMLRVLSRILADNLPDGGVEVPDLGNLKVTKDLFVRTNDIIPVSDPNIFSDAQRLTQIQAVMQASQTAPQLYNPAELHKRFLQLINLPDYDRVLSVPQASGRLNAVAENESALAGTPMQAFPEQDHLAHIKTHVEFLASPIYGMNPMFIQKMQGLVQHTMEHVGLLYAQAFNDALMNENEEIAILEAEGVPQTDQKLAELNPGILAGVEELLQPYVDQMAQILQKISEAMPNQETDPRMAKVHVDEMELQRKSQKDQMDYEIAKEKIQEDKQYNANMLQVEQIKTSTELKIEQMRGARAHGNEVRTAQAQAHEMRLKDAKHMLEVQKVQDQSRQQSVASKQKPTK